MEVKVFKGKNKFYHVKGCKFLGAVTEEYNCTEDAEKAGLIACTLCKPKEAFSEKMNPPEGFTEVTVDTSGLPFPDESPFPQDEPIVEEPTIPDEVPVEEPVAETVAVKIVGNNGNKSFHLDTCQFAPKNPAKRVEFASIEEAKKAGYKPCSTCNPK